MALKMSTTTLHGMALSDAYIRIEDQSGGKNLLDLRVRTYLNKEKCAEGCQWISEGIHSFVPSVEDDAPNFIKQGYEHLKTLDDFTEAIDV